MWLKCVDKDNAWSLINSDQVAYVETMGDILRCFAGEFVHEIKTLEGEPATVQRWMESINKGNSKDSPKIAPPSKPSPQDFLESMDLPIRIHERLRAKGYISRESFLNANLKALSQIPGIGRTSLSELRRTLYEFGVWDDRQFRIAGKEWRLS